MGIEPNVRPILTDCIMFSEIEILNVILMVKLVVIFIAEYTFIKK